MRLFIFAIVSITVIGTASYYIYRRLVRSFPLNAWQRNFIRFMVVGIILAMPVSLALRRHGVENAAGDWLAWAGYVGLGFLSFIFTLLVIRDVSYLVVRIVAWFRSRIAGLSGKSSPPDRLPDPDRRNFLAQSMNTGIIAVSGVLTGYGYANATQIPDVKTVEVPIPDLPEEFDGFRIVQLTDIHVSPTIKRPFVEAVVAQTNELKPDMVALTGDLVDGSVARLRDDVAPLADLSAREGCFFVTGNHEYYSGVYDWVAHIRRLGFRVLLNEHHLISRNNAGLLIAGVTDYRGGGFDETHRSDPKKAMHNAPASDYKILLAHQPKSIYQAAGAGFDLQISGHTHGGQFFPWNFFVKLDQPFIVGLHRYRNTHIYVSRGTGYWGPPLRVGSPSEITLIKLTRDKTAI